MKNIFYSLLAGMVALVFITGCKKDKTIGSTKVSAVSNLFLPEDGKYIKIASGASGSVAFEWEQARAENNGLVLYEVVFDKEGGDFSSPLYSLPSDGNGLYNKLTLTYSDLSKIAALSGVKPQESGKVIWSVVSSKGINPVPATQSRVIEIERPAGFTDIPTELYITGIATEGGDDLSKALKFKETAPGKFEIYTSLKAGSFHFADRKTGTPSTYSYDGTKLTEEGNTDFAGATKVEKIEVDFNVAAYKTTEVTNVGLWFSNQNKIWFELPYAGNGTWKVTDQNIKLDHVSYGLEERYKFRFTFKNTDGTSTQQFYGSANSDNSAATSATPPSYYYVVPVNNSQYDYTFKFNHDIDNKNADILVLFNSDAAAYTHQVIIK